MCCESFRSCIVCRNLGRRSCRVWYNPYVCEIDRCCEFSRCAVLMKTMKSQWKIVEPTRCEAQYYSSKADERGEYRTCRIDVVVVANKVERERTAVMEGACCCSLTRRVDFDFRRLEKWSGICARWTPNFERLGSGWRNSILPSVLCVLSNKHYYLILQLFV